MFLSSFKTHSNNTSLFSDFIAFYCLVWILLIKIIQFSNLSAVTDSRTIGLSSVQECIWYLLLYLFAWHFHLLRVIDSVKVMHKIVKSISILSNLAMASEIRFNAMDNHSDSWIKAISSIGCKQHICFFFSNSRRINNFNETNETSMSEMTSSVARLFSLQIHFPMISLCSWTHTYIHT